MNRMAAKPVKVAFLADTSDLRSSLSQAEKAMDSAGDTAKTAGAKIDTAFESTAGHADDVASKGAQAAGALSGLGDLVGGKFGAAMTTGGVAMQAFADAGDLVNVVTESAIVKKIKDAAVTAVQTARNLASAAAQRAVATATKVWAVAQRVLNAAMRANPIGLVITAITLLAVGLVVAYKRSETFRNIVNRAFDVVKRAAAAVGNAVRLYFSIWVTAIKSVINFTGSLVSRVRNGFDNVVGFIRGVPGRITALGGRFQSAGSSLMHRIVDGIKGAAGFIGNIASGIWNAVKSMLNQAIGQINNALEFSVKIPLGPTISVNPPDIPYLANGGIVTRATLAVVGEAGPEAVIPLDRAGGLGGDTYVVNLNGTFLGSKAEVGRAVQSALDEYSRSGGRRRAS